jgi:hypothetical protein
MPNEQKHQVRHGRWWICRRTHDGALLRLTRDPFTDRWVSSEAEASVFSWKPHARAAWARRIAHEPTFVEHLGHLPDAHQARAMPHVENDEGT